MSTMPEGAQVSPDGHYWWDGSAWQPVQGGSGAAPAAGATAQGGQGDASASLVQAFATAGVTVDASVVGDGQAVGRVAAQLGQWYGALDATSKAVVDALCGQGLTHLLADPEVGVLQEGADFLYALSTAQLSLGAALQATNQAIQQSGQPQQAGGDAGTTAQA